MTCGLSPSTIAPIPSSSCPGALEAIRKRKPAKLVLAVPVAPEDSLRELEPECDEVVCLATPDPFYAVGSQYVDFTQTTDAEVKQLLDEARGTERPVETT